MRRIEVIFSGGSEAEKKVADTIQQKIFDTLGSERMDIKSYSNTQTAGQGNRPAAATLDARSIKIPEFLRSGNRADIKGK